MPKRTGNYKPGPGRDSFEKVHGEPAVSFKLQLTQSQYSYLTAVAQDSKTSIAEVVRGLVDRDMKRVKVDPFELSQDGRQYLIGEYESVTAGLKALIERDRGEKTAARQRGGKSGNDGWM